MSALGIFAKWEPVYRRIGLEPCPIKPGGKACKVRGWQRPHNEIDPAELDRWLTAYPDHGIGLRMGTPLPGRGRLGAIDVDDDRYVDVARALLRDPKSCRIGSKGITCFVRVFDNLPNATFKSKGGHRRSNNQIVDCLFDRKLCVIPPTIHPDTKKPYRWIGTPLHELNLDLLPILGA